MEGRLPETVLKGGAGSGVLRPRLVTAGSGGPGHRLMGLLLLRFLNFLPRNPRREPDKNHQRQSARRRGAFWQNKAKLSRYLNDRSTERSRAYLGPVAA
jgi:hypothetical protein